MPTILVAVDAPETNAHVIEEAIKQTEREHASLIVLYTMPSGVYEARQLAIGRTPDLQRNGFTYTITQAQAAATTIARQAAREAIGDRDVRYIAVGRVGKFVPAVLATAAEYNCETIILPQAKSWWKRRFGLAHRRLKNRFDGTLVQVPHPVPLSSDPDRTRPQV